MRSNTGGDGSVEADASRQPGVGVWPKDEICRDGRLAGLNFHPLATKTKIFPRALEIVTDSVDRREMRVSVSLSIVERSPMQQFVRIEPAPALTTPPQPGVVATSSAAWIAAQTCAGVAVV